MPDHRSLPRISYRCTSGFESRLAWVDQMIVKALVPDTNFWLHARRPFDFQAIAGGEESVVAVPTKALNELDKLAVPHFR